MNTFDDSEQGSSHIVPLSEVFASAIAAVNAWLAEELGRRDLQVRLVVASSAKRIAIEFERAAQLGRRVDWDWQDLYFRKVRYRDAWMFSIVCHQVAGAMCYGTVNVREHHVDIEYLERAAGATELEGLVIATGYQFALTVAGLVGATEVRINQPFEELVPLYLEVLGGERHPQEGAIQYISVKVSS